jgi:hypothetical protein
MNETLYSVLNLVRDFAEGSQIKVTRGFADFLSDRILQAGTKSTLLGFAEYLATALNVDLDSCKSPKVAAFLRVAQTPGAGAVLAWIRKYSRITALIATRRKDDLFEQAINDIAVDALNVDMGVALPTRMPDIPITMTCLSPLAHGSDQKAGNATLFRRMEIISDKSQVLVLPFYAGNAFRGQMRDLLTYHFLYTLSGGVTDLEKAGKPTAMLQIIKDFFGGAASVLWMFHALFEGGSLEEDSKAAAAIGKRLGQNGAVNAQGMYEFRDMVPMLSILGTALGNRILSGKINNVDYRPICKEWGYADALPAAELFTWTYLTRRNDDENHNSDEGKSAAMIANTECLKAGTVLKGGVNISDHITDIELSCLGMGLKLMQREGYIGAENRRDMGQVKIDIENPPDYQPYQNYLVENRAKILTYLQEIGGINAPVQPNSAIA